MNDTHNLLFWATVVLLILFILFLTTAEAQEFFPCTVDNQEYICGSYESLEKLNIELQTCRQKLEREKENHKKICNIWTQREKDICEIRVEAVKDQCTNLLSVKTDKSIWRNPYFMYFMGTVV